MHVRKYRWSKVYESAEEELVQLLAAKHITVIRWQADDGEQLADRQFTEDTRLWCAEGQLRCTIAGTTYSLQSGDVLELPAGKVCSMQVGFGGCALYESRHARTLAASE